MEPNRKINFKRYTLPSASKQYVFRIVAYIVLLSVLIWLMYYLKNNSESTDKVQEVIEVKNIQIIE